MAHEITFYIKQPSQAASLSDFILSLNKTSIYIHANDAQHAQSISEILWAHPKDRFIANMVDTPCPDPIILIGYTDVPSDRQFIINCSNQQITPTHIEWVIQDNEQTLVLARERYKTWRSKGHPLKYNN